MTDLFASMASTPTGAAILARLEEESRRRDGTARQVHWQAEDGWYVTYTTSRVEGGPHDGKFVVQLHRPFGPGARTNPTRWRETYRRAFRTRKQAKARALELYAKHSPKWAARREAADAAGGGAAGEMVAAAHARADAAQAACAARPGGHRFTLDGSAPGPEDENCWDCGAWEARS